MIKIEKDEFHLTGARVQGVVINGRKYLIVVAINDDAFNINGTIGNDLDLCTTELKEKYKLSEMPIKDVGIEGNFKHLTRHNEFFSTGCFLQGVEIDGNNILMVTAIEDDTYCDSNSCNDRVEKDYGL